VMLGDQTMHGVQQHQRALLLASLHLSKRAVAALGGDLVEVHWQIRALCPGVEADLAPLAMDHLRSAQMTISVDGAVLHPS